MNGKLIVIVLACLIIGVGVGFGVGFIPTSIIVVNRELEISKLRIDYDNLNATYNQLKTDYNSLKTSNMQLQNDCQQLEGNYSALQTRYSELEANYTLLKSVNYTFDSSIQISNLTIDVSWLGVTYVRGNVTNIGATPIKSLFVFVFQYNSDGSLRTGPYYNEHIENLYPNETLPFEISFSTVEGQMFKIFAVGNY